jgi:DNA-directed RNA polymerase specialized sigma24 family protein
MNGEADRNEGVRVVAQFTDRAVPLDGGAALGDGAGIGTRSANEGIRILAEFRNAAEPIAAGTTTAANGNTADEPDAALKRQVAEVIAQLSPDDVQLVVALLEGRSAKETAEKLGGSLRTVRARIRSLRERIKTHFARGE